MAEIISSKPQVTAPASEELKTAFPLPSGPGFGEHLFALDVGYSPPGSVRAVHRARPFRVLLLAFFAVLVVLMLATAAAAATWKLADERYVDQVIRENL